MTTILDLDTIAQIVRESVPAHLVGVFPEDGGSVQAPGLVIYWDSQDSEGWAYREAQQLDPDTMSWDGEESGSVDDDCDVLVLAMAAAERMA